jgi:putative oxidoreductase
MKILNKPFVNASTVTALLRFILAAVFFYHGSQKVMGWFGGYGLEATIAGFEKTGISAPLAYLAAFTEFLGAFALLFGAFTRVFALGISIVMLVAIFKVHLHQGFAGFEFQLSLLVMALAVFLYGPGDYSVDKKLKGKVN